MISPQGISKEPFGSPSLNFKQLRAEGIQLIQALSGSIWTDYNLHDPGVTTLEILCYALTELGYRTELVKEAFEAEGEVDQDFIEHYFWKGTELLPHLPLTKWDFEEFIEKKHSNVLSVWFESNAIPHPNGLVRGNYDIAVLLAFDDKFGNLNCDSIRTPIDQLKAVLEVILFDERSRRMQWGNIEKIESCSWDELHPDNFFVFEKYNCHVALKLKVVFKNQKVISTRNVRARIAVNPLPGVESKIETIEPFRDTIIEKLASTEFQQSLNQALVKEQYKARLLTDIQKSLFLCRNLCENFISLRVVNEQEIKIDAEIKLNDNAPLASQIINAVFDCLDSFFMQMMRQSKQPAYRSLNNILYASNLIEEIVKVAGVEAASIRHLNLFVDGVPTIPLEDETSFECIHLQHFSNYLLKISREKSTITFIRLGNEELVENSEVSKEFIPQRYFLTDPKLGSIFKTDKDKAKVLNQNFFEDLRQYSSIKNDFPQNYRLREGHLSSQAPEELKVRVLQFKAYLVFFERILVNYLEKLYQLPGILSLKQNLGTSENELPRLIKQLPDLEELKLVDENKWEEISSSLSGGDNQLHQQHKIFDHLLARFATSYTPILLENSDAKTMGKVLQAKMLLLKDIPLITKERGLGLPVKPAEKGIWDNDLLSGFQKRIYRLLGVNNQDLKHLQLTKISGSKPVGFYLVEHILLVKKEESTILSEKFNTAAELLFNYIIKLVNQNSPSDPYSLQMTIILPDWYEDWNKRRTTVENAIRNEVPAHILSYCHWLDKNHMGEFETLYEDWLKALLLLYKA